jgi:hypothetical protein
MAREITYDSIKQKVEAAGLLDPPPQSGVPAGTAVTGTFTGEVTIEVPQLPPIEFPMEDLTYGSNVRPASSPPLNIETVLSIKSGNGGKVNNYSQGGQILINSNRIILNAREDYLMLFGRKGVAIASPEPVNIDSEATITLFGEKGLFLGVPNKGNAITAVPEPKEKGDPTQDQVYEPLVLGIKLANLLEDLLVILKNATLLTPVGKGYFREDVMYEFASLQARLPEILSTYAYIDGISHSATDPKPEKPKKLTEPPTTLTGTVTGTFNGLTTGPDPNAPAPVTNPLADQPQFFESETLYNDPL